MSIPLDDPRLLRALQELIDRRVEAGIRQTRPYHRYGIAAADGDVVTRKVPVYLYGQQQSTPNISFGLVAPRRGDHVRVFIGPRGDHYIDEVLGRSVVLPEQLPPTTPVGTGTDPVDRALGIPVRITETPAARSFGFVGSAKGTSIGTSIAATLGSTPAVGSLLVAYVGVADDGAEPTWPAGWQRVVNRDAGGHGQPIAWNEIRWKIAGASEPTTVTVTHPSASDGGLVVANYSVTGGVPAVDLLGHTWNDVASAIWPPATPVNRPAAGEPTVIVGIAANYDGTNLIPGAMTTRQTASSGGTDWRFADRVIASASPPYSYTVANGGTGLAHEYVLLHVAFTITGPLTSLTATEVTDGDDATYRAITGSPLFSIDLGAAYRIVRARLLIGAATAGSKTYTLWGGNEPDLADAVLLASKTVTMAGTFDTADIAMLWTPATSYRYYELRGPSESVRVHTLELYEAAPGQVIATDPDTGDPGELDDVLAALQARLDALAEGTTFVHVPLEYGIVGDDTFDNTAALQAAIDDWKQVGATLYLGRGTFKITAQLDFDPASITSGRLTLLGEGGNDAPATVIRQATANAHGIVANANAYALLLDSVWLKGPGGGTTGDGVQTPRNVHAFDARIDGWRKGLAIGNQAYYSKLIRTFAYQCSTAGFEFAAGANNMALLACRAEACAVGLDIQGAESPTVIGGAYEQNTTAGIRVNGGGNGQGGYIAANYFEQGAGVPDILIGNSSQVQGLHVGPNTHIKPSHGATSGWSVDAVNAVGLVVEVGYTDSTEAVRVAGSSGPAVVTDGTRQNSGTITLPAGSVLIDTSSTTPQPIGTAAAGTSPKLARVDHVHAGGTSFGTPAVVLGTAAAAGAASTALRTDATIVAFDATAPVTQAFGDAAAVGAAAVAARRDHRHGMPATPTVLPTGVAGHGAFYDDASATWKSAQSPEPLVLEDGSIAILEDGHVAMSEPIFD